MVLNSNTSQLLVVDVQEKILPVMCKKEELIRNSKSIITSASELEIPILFSEQYPKGLGNTDSELLNISSNVKVFEKETFSCADDAQIFDCIKHRVSIGFKQIVIIGIEMHICVLQSALGLKARGLDVYVVVDATASRNKDSLELAKMRLLFNQVNIVSTEMVIFEWLKVSGTDIFKKLSRLIK